MSLSVEKSQVSDVTAKLELAERMAGHAGAPKQALESIFEGAMRQIEKIAEKQFDTSLKQRVWDMVSKQQLESLKEYFLLEFCENILGTFSNNEAEEMLEEHKRTGSIRHYIYSSQIQTSYQLHHSAIIDSVQVKAESMTDNWIPEIVKAAREEGIELPEPREKTI